MHLNAISVNYLEDNPFKKILLIPKESVNDVLPLIMSYEPNDISIEEEEVGAVVERIYQEGSDIFA